MQREARDELTVRMRSCVGDGGINPPGSPQAKDQVNLTDAESRIMPRRGGFVPGYNDQATVDVESLLIATTHVTQAPNDKQQIEPTLERLAALPETLGRATHLLADTGYASAANVKACEDAAASR